MPPSPAPLIEVQRLCKDYPSSGPRLPAPQIPGSHIPSGFIRVVDDVSFRIIRGETLGLVGESGSGKSTVARMLLRLIEPSAGQLRFDGQDLLALQSSELRSLRRRMQIVFQDPYAALNPRMRIREILSEPFAIHARELRCDKSDLNVPARINELLHSVGLDTSALPRFPHEFSGGQRQRINIARALALNPDFLVLDEPISALDVSVGAQIINLLQRLQRERSMTYLFISHSMPLVRYLCDRIAVMQRGKLVEIGDAIQVCEHPEQPYTKQLIAATPELMRT